MKKVFFAGLLGLGLLLPTTYASANSHIVRHRIIDCTLEDDALGIIVTSQESDGTLMNIQVFDGKQNRVMNVDCSGYYWELFIGNLPKGQYTAKITATMASSNYNFTVN